jgi:glycosyltransferase involved in cell wall biosynthesis
MRILYHHKTLGDGAEGIHVSAMVDAFRALGHSVDVVALIGEQTNTPTRRVRALSRIRRLVPQSCYEALEVGYTVVGSRALRQAIAKATPDFIYERYTLFNCAGVFAAKRAGIPLVLEVNAPLAYERAAYEKLSMPAFARRCERFVCSAAHLVVAVSTPLKEYLSNEGVLASRILVVPNAADPEVFRPNFEARTAIRSRYGIPPSATVIGFTGILRPWHGVDLLVRAVANLSRVDEMLPWLFIVGDGPSRSEVEHVARESGLRNRLVITGRVQHSQLPHYIAAFDIGVSPHATFYASPMKLPEYMAVGVAVVAPLMANITDLIVDGKTGLLFEPKNQDSLTVTLQRPEPHLTMRSDLC